jgi:hypothetical protein
MLTVDLETARHFILGKQGLWPGRRWRGVKGPEKVMRAMEYLQLEPLQITPPKSFDCSMIWGSIQIFSITSSTPMKT